MRSRSEAQSGRYHGSDYRWVADWQSVQSRLITCWNIWIDNREDCISVLCGHKISLYTGRPSGQRTEDCPPEPVLGDSVMSGRLLISGRHLWSLMSGGLISGRHLILTLPSFHGKRL